MRSFRPAWIWRILPQRGLLGLFLLAFAGAAIAGGSGAVLGETEAGQSWSETAMGRQGELPLPAHRGPCVHPGRLLPASPALGVSPCWLRDHHGIVLLR